jgi:hypothetical protein
MKKRILIVQPLLSLALISSSALWSMETPKPTTLDAKSENEQQIDQLIAEVIDMKLVPEAVAVPKKMMSPEEMKHREKFGSVLTAIKILAPVDSANLDAEQKDAVAASKNLHAEQKDAIAASNLAASMIQNGFYLSESPEEELSLFGFVADKWSNIKTAVYNIGTDARTSVINYLTKNQFDQYDKSHNQLLEDALAECEQHKDLTSLGTIITQLQKDRYAEVRCSDKSAETIFNYLAGLYQEQVQSTNKRLTSNNISNAKAINEKSVNFKSTILTLCEEHKKTLTQLAGAYDADVQQETKKVDALHDMMVSFAAFNGAIRYKHISTFAENRLDKPSNSLADIQEESQKRLRELTTRLNMPTANTDIFTLQAQKNTRTKAILPALTDKK